MGIEKHNYLCGSKWPQDGNHTTRTSLEMPLFFSVCGCLCVRERKREEKKREGEREGRRKTESSFGFGIHVISVLF